MGGGFPNVSLIMSCLVAKDFLCSYNQGQSLTVLTQTLQGLVPAHFARLPLMSVLQHRSSLSLAGSTLPSSLFGLYAG